MELAKVLSWSWLALSVVLLGILLAYVQAARRQAWRRSRWSFWRTLSFSAGIGIILIGAAPPLADFAHHDLRGHMVQHLMLGMFAPLGLVFAAPVSLLLRSMPAEQSRKFIAFLRSPVLRLLSHPVSALLLNVGGMYLLYLTPMYAASLSSATLHGLVHLHFIVAGCLFTWAIAGPDPGPSRPSQTFRLTVLFLSIAAHAFLAKLIYAYGWPRGGGHSSEEIQAAAQLMYYGGDLAEMLLVLGLLYTWAGKRAPASAGRTGLVFTARR